MILVLLCLDQHQQQQLDNFNPHKNKIKDNSNEL